MRLGTGKEERIERRKCQQIRKRIKKQQAATEILMRLLSKIEKKERYRFFGWWGLPEQRGKTVIKVEDINLHEFRGYFEGEEEIDTKGKSYNFLCVFQYNDVIKIKEG